MWILKHYSCSSTAPLPAPGTHRTVPGPPHQPTSLLADSRESPALPSTALPGGGAAQQAREHRLDPGLTCAPSGPGPAPLSSLLRSEPAGPRGPRRPSLPPPPRFAGLQSSGNSRGGLPGAPQRAGAGDSSPVFLPLQVFRVEQTDLSLRPWLLRVTVEVSGLTAQCPIPSGQTEPKLRSRVVKAGACVSGTSPLPLGHHQIWGFAGRHQ